MRYTAGDNVIVSGDVVKISQIVKDDFQNNIYCTVSNSGQDDFLFTEDMIDHDLTEKLRLLLTLKLDSYIGDWTIEELIEYDVYICCSTEEDAKDLINKLYNAGFSWGYSPEGITSKFENYGKNTYYAINNKGQISHGSIEFVDGRIKINYKASF